MKWYVKFAIVAVPVILMFFILHHRQVQTSPYTAESARKLYQKNQEMFDVLADHFSNPQEHPSFVIQENWAAEMRESNFSLPENVLDAAAQFLELSLKTNTPQIRHLSVLPNSITFLIYDHFEEIQNEDTLIQQYQYLLYTPDSSYGDIHKGGLRFTSVIPLNSHWLLVNEEVH